MKTQSILTVLAIAIFIPSVASADKGLFVAASVGSAELSDSFDGFDIDADSTAYRFSAGWRFNDYLAFDAGYQNFGRFDQTDDHVKGRCFSGPVGSKQSDNLSRLHVQVDA